MAPFPLPASEHSHSSTSTHFSPTSFSSTSPTPTSPSRPDPDPSNDKRLLTAIIVLFLVAAALITFIIWLTLRVKHREEAARLRAQAEATGLSSSTLPSAGATSPVRKRQGASVDRRDKAGKVIHADHLAAQITPFGGAPSSVGGGRPRFDHTPGSDMRIAHRRPDGAWDFADPRTPFNPAGVSELESDIVPAVPPLTRLSVTLRSARLLASPSTANGRLVSNPFSPVSRAPVITTVPATISSSSTPPGISSLSKPVSTSLTPSVPHTTFNKPLPMPPSGTDHLSLSFTHEPSSPFSYITNISHGTPAQTPRTTTITPRARELTPNPGMHTNTLYHKEREIDRDCVPSSPFSFVSDPACSPTTTSESPGLVTAAARKEAEARWERERERALGRHGDGGQGEGGAPPAYWDGRDC